MSWGPQYGGGQAVDTSQYNSFQTASPGMTSAPGCGMDAYGYGTSACSAAPNYGAPAASYGGTPGYGGGTPGYGGMVDYNSMAQQGYGGGFGGAGNAGYGMAQTGYSQMGGGNAMGGYGQSAMGSQYNGGKGGGGDFPQGPFVGYVKSFSEDRGWGHIDCVDARRIFGKDVFLNRNAIQGHSGPVNEGDRIKFTVRMEAKGAAAQDAWILGPGEDDGLGAASPGTTFGSQGGANGPFVGLVKGFNEEKGWGHIACEATSLMFGKDIFVMRSSLRGSKIQAGDYVEFYVRPGHKGPEASECRPLPQDGVSSTPNPLDQLAGKELNGTVKLFDETKGWGFIESMAIKEFYGKDIFVHKREFLEPDAARNGEEVVFVIFVGRDGRPEAKQVRRRAAGTSEGFSQVVGGVPPAEAPAGTAGTPEAPGLPQTELPGSNYGPAEGDGATDRPAPY